MKFFTSTTTGSLPKQLFCLVGWIQLLCWIPTTMGDIALVDDAFVLRRQQLEQRSDGSTQTADIVQTRQLFFGEIINGTANFIGNVACGTIGLWCDEEEEDDDDDETTEEIIDTDDSTSSTTLFPRTVDGQGGAGTGGPLQQIACELFPRLCENNEASRTVVGNTTVGEQVDQFLKCGLFGNLCNDDDDMDTGSSISNEVQGTRGGGLVGDILYGIGCGIFDICDEDYVNIANNTECYDVTDGILGGRPWFGECGVIPEFLKEVFNGTSDSINQFYNGTDGDFALINLDDPDGPFSQIFAEGGLLFNIFNQNSDTNLWRSILESFQETTNKFAFGFLEEWSENAVASNVTCAINATTATTQPECADQYGNDGFWTCRTLYDPFTGIPDSKSVCIGEGDFLVANDECGCCNDQCPATCTCECDMDNDGVLDGVWITSADVGNTMELISERCVKLKFAVSVTSRFAGINCLETCS